MMAPGPIWAFLGLLTGARKFLFVSMLALLLFGTPGALRHLAPGPLRVWLSASRPGGPTSPRLGRRTRLVLKGLCWVALAAWVATRATRIGPARSTH